MKLTLKQQILDLIRAEYPGNLSNNQIATRLGANEPSVRRACLELDRAGFITGGYMNKEKFLSWMFRVPVETLVAPDVFPDPVVGL